jgi:glycosyltransferase involved in cell wall biosynthesis
MHDSAIKVRPLRADWASIVSQLFSEEWYIASYPDIARAGVSAIDHFMTVGWAEGRSPCPLFDTEWYFQTYPDVEASGINPLLHYALYGWKERRNPHPDFDTGWYLDTHQDVAEADINPLLHYILVGRAEARSISAATVPAEIFAPEKEFDQPSGLDPHEEQFGSEPHPDRHKIIELFDEEFYVAGFPETDRPSDPASHFLETGWKEGRNPTPWFSVWHYSAMHEDVARSGMNPFVHYCLAGVNENRALAVMGKGSDSNAYRAQAFAVAPGPLFEEFDPKIGMGRRKRAKVLAYFLPQFHPIEVNDRQWGKGFTEWRQLARAMPRFNGHIQPRIPRDLGCYDLAESDVMRRQIEMAKAAGLHGFCFYHYWFDGKRVLETPMERFLADPTLDFPICLMWANENWTRTWDGSEKEMILQQTYAEADDVPFIDDVARHMNDRRYIRIDDRPIFFIYRPGHIPETAARLAKWRTIFRERHGLNPLIFQAQAFGDNDPRAFSVDGAIEFPPHKVLNRVPDLKHQMGMFDVKFEGTIPTYQSIVDASKSDPQPDYPLIRTVFPGWDNDARRPGRSTIMAHSTPELFGDWLEWAVQQAERYPVFGEPFVCINAWNEWAEGAYLEPDVHFGAAYLNTVSRVIHADKAAPVPVNRSRVLLVGHDTFSFGAQNLICNIGRELKTRFGVEVTFLILASNAQEGSKPTTTKAMEEIGPVIFADKFDGDKAQLAEHLKSAGYEVAITNTTPSGAMAPALKKAGFRIVSLIHELPTLLRGYQLLDQAQSIAQYSDVVVFPAEIVRSGFEAYAGGVQGRAYIYPQGLYNTSVLETPRGDHGVRSELGLSSGTRIVLGVGYADLRKGIDRFVAAGVQLCREQADVAFVWVGAPSGEASHWFEPDIAASGLGDRIRILGQRDDVARFFAAANAFYLSSREDPFPSVVLEALACGLPVLGHEGCGGCDDLIRQHGVLLDRENVNGAANAFRRLLDDPDGQLKQPDREEIVRSFDFSSYVFGLLQHLLPELPSVSVVIPNYNYERYIASRIESVLDQELPIRELIVLDDASADGSLAEIRRVADSSGRRIELAVNTQNSGSAFRQWRRAAQRAKGEYLWIAEADDLAEPAFLSRLIERMQADGSVLGFTDSRQIDQSGALLGESYKAYMSDVAPGAFEASFRMSGQEFLQRFLSVKNVILNVSGAVIRRDALLEAFSAAGEALYEYQVAGDWRLYAEICARPGAAVTWLAEPLNTHRRHKVSVTQALKIEKHLEEIESMQSWVAAKVDLSPAILEQQRTHLEACSRYLKSR